MTRFVHTLPSGTVLTAIITDTGLCPEAMINGDPEPEEMDEANHWFSEVVLPAMAQMSLDALTDIDP